ncbi:phosphate signaling complex protein PhoU [Alteromonadaceae bacterium BrNp21-10]|nr:phosphate signaling complex protein PhoU [Alteromonadaceae bacterium BrNp21-10]
MENFNLNKHISGQFNDELENLRNHVLKMGGLVEQQLADALTAVENTDRELAHQVLTNDYKVNLLEVSIDEECAKIIAKRQPAASDLRLILAITKTVSDLERIGDEAGRIAKVALASFSSAQQDFLTSLNSMGQRVLKMLHNTLDAFVRMDVEAAFKVHKYDQKIDREYEAMTRQLMTYMMEDPRSIPKVMDVLWSSRSLERIGDRCQNICEYVIYFVKGKDVRHITREQIQRDIMDKK